MKIVEINYQSGWHDPTCWYSMSVEDGEGNYVDGDCTDDFSKGALRSKAAYDLFRKYLRENPLGGVRISPETSPEIKKNLQRIARAHNSKFTK